MRSDLLIVDLGVCTIGILFRNLSPVSISLRLFPTFPYIKLSVSGFMLRYFSYLDLSFVQGDRYGLICTMWICT